MHMCGLAKRGSKAGTPLEAELEPAVLEYGVLDRRSALEGAGNVFCEQVLEACHDVPGKSSFEKGDQPQQIALQHLLGHAWTWSRPCESDFC